MNSKTRLTTGILVSTGKDADINAARFLLDDDMKKGIDISLLTADKAYDDGDRHYIPGTGYNRIIRIIHFHGRKESFQSLKRASDFSHLRLNRRRRSNDRV